MYMHFPHLNPIMFSIGPVSAHWYGFMYLISFIFALWYRKKKHIKNSSLNITEENILLYYIFLGACIGGRIGYIIFYHFLYFTNNILSIFEVWRGGMSFHGGLIGVIIVIFYFSLKYKKKFLVISDFIVPFVPFGLGAGRIGNFINGELWGRIAVNFPYAMLFPQSRNEDIKAINISPELTLLLQKHGSLPRHPSQLYEFVLEGVVLFLIIYLFNKKNRPIGSVSGVFLLSYGIFRTIIEYFREPDPQIGLFFNLITMGQILSAPMIITGSIIIITSFYNAKKTRLISNEKILDVNKKNY